MIIKSMTAEQILASSLNPPRTTRHTNLLKLPAIDNSNNNRNNNNNNLMYSSRTGVKNNKIVSSVFDSLKILVQGESEKEGEEGYSLSMHKKKKGVRKYSRRVRTDVHEKQQAGDSSYSPNKYHTGNSSNSVQNNIYNYNKKNIAQKLLKITNQLGMNSSDYRNYMKTDRRIYSTYQQKSETKNNTYRVKKESQGQSLPLEEAIVRINDENDGDGLEISERVVINILRYNLKQKPNGLQGLKNMKKKANNKKYLQCSNKSESSFVNMNKSIRGWTKYGKLQEEIQY